MFRKFLNLKFGLVQPEELFKALFIIGVIPIVMYGFSGMFFLNLGLPIIALNRIRLVSFGSILYSFIALFFILIFIVLWKITCELIFLIFKFFDVYIKRNG